MWGPADPCWTRSCAVASASLGLFLMLPVLRLRHSLSEWIWLLHRPAKDGEEGKDADDRRQRMEVACDPHCCTDLAPSACEWGLNARMCKEGSAPFQSDTFAARFCCQIVHQELFRSLYAETVFECKWRYCYVVLRLTSFCVCLWRSWKKGNER